MRRRLAQLIWLFSLLVVLVGMVVLYSASYQNLRVSHDVFYDQAFCAGLGFLLMFLLSRTDYRRFYEVAYVVYGAAVFLLLLVMVAGQHALGAQRWFTIGGLTFQPSEVAKLGVILALGRYFTDHRPSRKGSSLSVAENLVRDLFVPLAIAGVPMYLIFKQPDLGSAILIFGIFCFMLFISGVRYRYFLGFLTVCLLLMPWAWHFLRPYQRDRLLVFLNPNIDPLGAGYTIIQSKIAIGSGQFLGKGWLSGTQSQLNFLPERHTDFIFSVIGEEWGLVGALWLLFCYLGLIYCGLKIADQVKDQFGVQVTVGIVGILILQVGINIGMVMGMLPVVGITLPLVSYGRTSFMVFMVLLGFLLSLSRRRTIF